MTFPILGVPVTLSPWALLLAAMLWIEGCLFIKKYFPNDEHRNYVTATAIATICIFMSVALHEFSHALTSYALGIRVVEAQFNGIGAYVRPAESLFEMPFYKESLISIAGPLTNFVIYGLTLLVVKKFGESLFENTVQFVCCVNYRLAVFNMLPLVVFDGYKFYHGILRGITGNIHTADSVLFWGAIAFFIWYLFFSKKKQTVEERLATL